MVVAPLNREFCTLFDVNYLPRGLVLYESLAAVFPPFRLRVFCMDDATKAVLDRLSLPRMTVIGLDELEAHDPALKAVKPTRTPVEYCWTATPAICLAALEREPELEAITYLDADLMFFADPGALFDEFGDASILITPHRYAPEWRYHERRRGTYNVQFLTFRRDDNGLSALRWWRERCLEWCYDRIEDGKMGDQAYLNDWPTRFSGVHVLRHPGGGLAPWNSSAHRLERRNGGLTVDGSTLVFFHYHGLRLHRGPALRLLARLPNPYRISGQFVWTSQYPVVDEERRAVWEPYLARLATAMADVRGAGGPHDPGVAGTSPRAVIRSTLREVTPAWLRRAVAKGRELRRARRVDEDGWRSADVVAQHRDLVRRELADPDAVPPYRAFFVAMETLMNERPLPMPARLLDFGCGLGHYGELLERRFQGRFEYVGCDSAPEMVEAARREWPGREFVVNDLFDNRLELGAYDVILAGALLDVVDDVHRGLDVLLAAPAPYIVLHRQRITEDASRTETAPGYRGQTTYRSFLNLRDLEAAVHRHGRRIAHHFDVHGDTKTFLIERAT
jgi:SAM-dependent methyltransferase